MDLGIFKRNQTDAAPLIDAILANPGNEALKRFMPRDTWVALAAYLSQERVDKGQVLIAEGGLDRTLYFVESGSLRVHREGPGGLLQIAKLGAGALVGEGSFFSHIERNATVQALEPGVVWSLSANRFDAMSHKDAPLALKLSLALGAVLSTRMLEMARNVTVT